MTAKGLRDKYLKFFQAKGHTIIPSASLVPRETDASTLFTTAGMHPLVPYLLGEEHPGGKRVASVQKCVRTADIDEVGDNRHLTFFEMMGNWSFGDYFKKEAIEWSYEFLTEKKAGLGLDPSRLYVTVFKGEGNIPRDEESIGIWQEVFSKNKLSNGTAGEDEMIKDDVRIIPLGTADNFWIAGSVGPCGGDTEMFYDTRPQEGKMEGKFADLVACGRIIEIWNNVFMEWSKQADGTIEKLAQHNVDTGMGVERTLAVLAGQENVFETELFKPVFAKIAEMSGKEYDENEDVKKSFRVIADHIKANTFMIADGVIPSNVQRGYVLRRLIRRAIRYAQGIGLKEGGFSQDLSAEVVKMYGGFYEEMKTKEKDIQRVLLEEENKFRNTLETGLKEFNKVIKDYVLAKEGGAPATGTDETIKVVKELPGSVVFNLYTTFGFPIELTREIAKEKGLTIDEKGFQTELEKHQTLSRTASAGAFKGGLQSQDENTARLHTATHLLLAALRTVLGDRVYQKGSNITSERLRFDFSHPTKMTPEQIAKVEELVNGAIEANMEVVREEMTLDEAREKEAMGVFGAKYGETVSVYSIGPDSDQTVSREICGGPHAKKTGELGHFKIQKEEASSAGIRRIKAVLE
jgi:alanyl-tRNA synthetase